jgi:hypothetical protein
MIAKKMKDGTYAVGDVCDGKFTVLATAADASEAKALVKTLEAVMGLFQARSGAWVTVNPPGKTAAPAPPEKPPKRKPKRTNS